MNLARYIIRASFSQGTGKLYFLSSDFGLEEFNAKSKKEKIRRYRRYVYEAVSINQPEKGKVKVIKNKVLEKERNRRFERSRTDRFKYRTRYFTDSGIIGSKEFVADNYQRFKQWSSKFYIATADRISV